MTQIKILDFQNQPTDLCKWMRRTDTYGFLYGEKYD